MDTKTYNPLLGATYYDTKDLAENIGMSFNTNPTNAGMLLTTEKTTNSGYDAKVLKEAKLSTNNNSYKFETIVPTIKVTSNNKKDFSEETLCSLVAALYQEDFSDETLKATAIIDKINTVLFSL